MKILQKLENSRGDVSITALQKAIYPTPFHGTLKSVEDLERGGLVQFNNGKSYVSILRAGKEFLREREFGLPYPSSNVE